MDIDKSCRKMEQKAAGTTQGAIIDLVLELVDVIKYLDNKCSCEGKYALAVAPKAKKDTAPKANKKKATPKDGV